MPLEGADDYPKNQLGVHEFHGAVRVGSSRKITTRRYAEVSYPVAILARNPNKGARGTAPSPVTTSSALTTTVPQGPRPVPSA